MDWSLYAKRVNVNGNSSREETINLSKESINNKSAYSPALKKVLVNNVEQPLLIGSTKKSNEKSFNTLPGGMINIGDSIVWNEMHWLVTEVDFDDEITRSGKIIQCNMLMRWQNKATFEIISRWCFAERPYVSGIDEGKVISTPNRQFRIKLPYDKETQLVDIGRRFILETIDGIQKSYKLFMPDLITSRFVDSEGGFIVWNLEFDSNATTPNDNLELGVCDYRTPDSPAPPPTPDPTLLKCVISGSSVLKYGGSARLYKPSFYLADGITLDETVVPIWSVEIAPAYAGKIISTTNGNSISLKCADDISVVGVKFKLKLVDDKSLYSVAETTIEVVSAFG
ncbi:MAG: hypothetical protein RR806_03155 [Oscillospiraceae bacterium]